MRVKVLGALEVEDDDEQPVAIVGAKQRALLTILAINVGRTVSADRLIDALWGDDPLADVGNALQRQVSRLRQALGRGRLMTRGTGYALDLAPEDVDAVRFEQLATEGRAQLRLGHLDEASTALRQAAELWRGAPLAEFDDEWARVEATRLGQLRLELLEDRMEVDLRCGLHQDVIGELESLVKEHPYRERLWGQLMVALYRCGRQTDALAAFQQARRVLSEEQGLEPGPELRGLEAGVLRHDPELSWTPAAAVATSWAATTPAALGNVPVPLTSFIGRHTQLVEALELVEAKTFRTGVLSLTYQPARN